eukprot:scaffold12930_cov69-Phaeocystis_antarctica.AAC.2
MQTSITCAACAGAHRKHTCSLHLRHPAEVPVNAAAPLLLPVKKRLSSTAPATDRDEKVASGCAACAGGHRKHTCGKAALPPPVKVRSESYCAACHGGHRKHTCKRKLAPGGDGGSGSTSGASGSGAGGDKASGKRRAGAESASSDGAAGKAASEAGCKACMGWHRGHTCGKSLRGSTDAD